MGGAVRAFAIMTLGTARRYSEGAFNPAMEQLRQDLRTLCVKVESIVERL